MTTDPARSHDRAWQSVLAGLNASQQEAVSAPAGPTLVLAGAGSGKTRVITHRIGWRLLVDGAPPESILAVTFTNKAAREMRTRVNALGAEVRETGSLPWVSTFHAFGLNLLRRFGGDIGLASGFPVFGADDSRALVRQVARELLIDDDRLPLGRLVQLISRLRNAEASGAAFHGPRDPRLGESVREATALYRRKVAELNGVDFDDLLIRALELLDASEAARAFVSRRVRHLLIDECETAEAQAIAIEIAAAGEGRGSTAVLLRTRAQTRAFEEAFAAHRIPHVIVGGLRFYERREVLDALACLRVAANPGDDSAFRRALAAIPRGVGPKSLRRIEEQGAEDETSLLAAAEQVVADRGLPARALNGLHAFLEGIAAVRRAIPGGPEKVVRSAIADTGLGPFFQENDRERLENLVSLQNAAREFERSNPDGTVDAFLDQVSLLSAEDLMPEEGADPGVAPVMVMTVHAAKGLEFDSVFLAGLWEGLFPHAFSLESDVQLEEERRLFYVGMTRARKRLQLSAAPGGAPYLRSRGGVSRFLGEIPRDLLDAARGEARAIPLGTVPAAGPFRKGDTVRHRKFGVGRVETVDPDGKRLSVLFRYYGRRRLVVEFARLERV